VSRARQPRRVVIIAALLFLWVLLYRFNTLGGALGGFDNDHFLHFAYAKQVQAGEQPLRDFLDAGLQGANPSLTYELSAAAQRLFGNNLRSEAWLTTAGVAAGAAAAFLAGCYVAPWPAALATAWLSAVISPKLYGYPKVLVLAVASLLIARYARAPDWRRACALAVLTAVAFLFRHDLAVYCALGTAVALVAVAATGRLPWTRTAAHAAVYALATALLLAPSFWWIETHTGIERYLRTGWEMGQRESQRTDIEWPVPSMAPGDSVRAVLAREENTQAWLYYLFLAVPALGVGSTVIRLARRESDADGRRATVLALSAMTAVLCATFLRGSLEGRFGDMAPPVAVVGATLIAASVGGGRRPLGWRVGRGALAAAIVVVTTVCVWSLQSVGAELARARLLDSPFEVATRAGGVSRELALLPNALRARPDASPSMQTADYLFRCTVPSDRVLVVAYAPEIFAFSERLFAGGRATFVPGFYADAGYEIHAVTRLERESVPLALADVEAETAEFPLVDAYLRTHFVDSGTIEIDGGRRLRLLAHRGLVGRPSGRDARPCFGEAATPMNAASQIE
jgi:hypothetical protein